VVRRNQAQELQKRSGVDWLASASAETADRLAGRSAWLLAAFSWNRPGQLTTWLQHVDQVLSESPDGLHDRRLHEAKPRERSVVLAV